MRKSKWLQKVLLCIGCVFLFLAGIGLGWIRCRQTETAFWEYILFAPEPEECVVCDNLQDPRFHAPCLLDLSTGELTELEIYEPCHRYSGELAPDQDMDYNVMTFGGSGLPLFIDRTEEIQRCVAYLPEKAGGEIEPSYYCRDCRAKLTKAATQGYVLLDLYDLDAIQVYPVEDGAEYSIRIYTVDVAHDEEQGHLVVTNIGHLFER